MYPSIKQLVEKNKQTEAKQDSPASQQKMVYHPDVGEKSYKGTGKLKGKVALVTGGDSGIGQAVALAFAREGCQMVMIQHLEVEKEDAEETKRLVEACGAKFHSFAADLKTEDACKKLADDVRKASAQVDILVLNHAKQGVACEEGDFFKDTTGERIRETLAVNIMSFFHIVQNMLPAMKPGAAVITTSSIQGYQPSPGILDYATSKGAIVNFTKGLARELITKGIRVNSVAPGPVWTPLIVQSFDKEKVNEFGDKHSYKRAAQPAELAPAYVFLASNADSSYVCGEILGVTGGGILG